VEGPELELNQSLALSQSKGVVVCRVQAKTPKRCLSHVMLLLAGLILENGDNVLCPAEAMVLRLDPGLASHLQMVVWHVQTLMLKRSLKYAWHLLVGQTMEPGENAL